MSGDARNILITGCSSGIGRATALMLHGRGYRVFATARRREDVAALSGAGLEGIQLDLVSSSSIRSAVAQVLDRSTGRLHGIVNNGAYGQPGAVEDLSRDTLREQFETNVFGTQELTNHVIPVFRAQGCGRIIQISSLLGVVCLAYRGAYSASKFALEALSDTLRLELRGSGIHVCLVEPGPVSTRFRENAYSAYLRNIDRTASAHRDTYSRLEARLGGTRPLPFTLPPEAVARTVIRAMEARRPKIRYPVTVPTRFFAAARRLLPDRALDWLAAAAGGRGRR